MGQPAMATTSRDHNTNGISLPRQFTTSLLGSVFTSIPPPLPPPPPPLPLPPPQLGWAASSDRFIVIGNGYQSAAVMYAVTQDTQQAVSLSVVWRDRAGQYSRMERLKEQEEEDEDDDEDELGFCYVCSYAKR